MKSLLASAVAAIFIAAAPSALAAPASHRHGSHGASSNAVAVQSGPAHGSGGKANHTMRGPANSPKVGGFKASSQTTRRVHQSRGVHRSTTIQMGVRHHGIVTTTASPAAVVNSPAFIQSGRRPSRRGLRQNNFGQGNPQFVTGGRRSRTNVHINFNRRNVTARHHYRYRGRSWNWPRGYAYRRWAFGMILPSIFWANEYWIDDYYDYGLAPPPPGTVWVRYGNDAVLIDRYTGEILEVVYDQFY